MKAMTKLGRILKSRDITLLSKVYIVKAMVFPIVMYGCESWNIKEAERLKNWCFRTVVLERTLESPLDCKEIKPVNPKGNQPWIFIGALILKLKLQQFGHLMQSWLIGKGPDAGKEWGQEEKGTTEAEGIRWHHWLNGPVFEPTLGDGEGQGSLMCCSPWGCKESDMTEHLNSNILKGLLWEPKFKKNLLRVTGVQSPGTW